jgi:UPF0176 protein
MSHSPQAEQIVVCALYKFVDLPNFSDLRQPLLNIMLQQKVRGTLLLAHEGINGTIAGSRKGIDAVLTWLRRDSRLADLDTKESFTDTPPFLRSKVKLKKEIVTMGIEDIDPARSAGAYVEPQDWNALISDPDVLLIDTRNNYEVSVGSFKNAVNPNTETFREFPTYIAGHLDKNKHKKVAMYCTGGIRCEKSTAYLKEQGFEQVFHLKGGILNYLEKVPAPDSLWQGECFVFDDRVTVDHSLQKGTYDQCFACRLPITEYDKAKEHYEQGISCPYCYDKVSAERKRRFAEREKQMRLAEARGDVHMGSDVVQQVQQRRNSQNDL